MHRGDTQRARNPQDVNKGIIWGCCSVLQHPLHKIRPERMDGCAYNFTVENKATGYRRIRLRAVDFLVFQSAMYLSEPVSPEAAVCLSCGVAIKKQGAQGGDLAGKDKVTIALICFFLGGIGIHNFMMGETKKGVTKIVLSLCLGLGGIFALIDFIKILMDKYEVNPDKMF